MNLMKLVVLAALLLAGAGTARADTGLFILYAGAGETETYSEPPIATFSVTPYSAGYMTRLIISPNFVLGVDAGLEGADFDNTSASASYNLLTGLNFALTDSIRLYAVGLLGVRKEFDCDARGQSVSCEESNEPNTGGIVAIQYRRLMIGARATSESTQAIIGFSL